MDLMQFMVVAGEGEVSSAWRTLLSEPDEFQRAYMAVLLSMSSVDRDDCLRAVSGALRAAGVRTQSTELVPSIIQKLLSHRLSTSRCCTSGEVFCYEVSATCSDTHTVCVSATCYSLSPFLAYASRFLPNFGTPRKLVFSSSDSSPPKKTRRLNSIVRETPIALELQPYYDD
eukprot:NODE_4750_length_766_cov_41.073919_g4403_i0.p1 GENE.NODE_4750_length_766_cov_41.073919_g4403_i0~~NODE_4750_length_766_cov_41.073919_g4403_i0.p1  ORF type:complete len:172 (-),score=22.95 NODE_4750_length_766_cov_41.073919_g4403_i0:149-664(-)